MTLGELLIQCKDKRRETKVRVFVGCMTIFNGDPSNVNIPAWIKLHPYFNCKVLNQCMIHNTFVITL